MLASYDYKVKKKVPFYLVAVNPPSTGITVPVIKLALSETSHKAAQSHQSFLESPAALKARLGFFEGLSDTPVRKLVED